MDFHGIDLNLLVAFDALMHECHVTRAAARVGVSQPAMSAALSRLRLLLGDPLFLRSAQGLQPTSRARELAEPVAQALQQLEAAFVTPPVFDAAQAAMRFSLGLSDYPAVVLLPALMQSLAKKAPAVVLNVRAFTDRDDAVALLDAGAIDAAIGVPPTRQEARILQRPLLRDELVTIVRHDHPAARKRMDLKTFLAQSHVLVSPEGNRHGLVDEALAQLGKQRHLALTLPQMFAVPAVVAQTQLIATVMKRVALHSPARRKLVLFPPPLSLPEIRFELIWHRRTEAHAGQRWMRDEIEAVARGL